MISKFDIQRLLHRPEGEEPILSVFLDMSVDSNNKRNHDIYLGQRKREHTELSSDREGHHPQALGEAFARIEQWLDESFEPENQGVALYTAIGGDWLEGLQFPVSTPNRLEITRYPVIGPLSQLIDRYHHHGVLVVDRQSVRMLSVYLGRSRIAHEARGKPYPAPHDIKAGGYSAKRYQRRMAEEVGHFFSEFAREVAAFDRRYRPDDLIVLGIADNVSRFLDALPEQLRDKVVHTDSAPAEPGDAAVLDRLAPFLEAQRRDESTQAVQLLRDRVQQNHLAISGLQDALEQLQKGQIDTLLMADDLEHTGARCTQCGFYVLAERSDCPYCGGELHSGVDLVEAMIRLAEEQEVGIRYLDPQSMADLDNVGALLKF